MDRRVSAQRQIRPRLRYPVAILIVMRISTRHFIPRRIAAVVICVFLLVLIADLMDAFTSLPFIHLSDFELTLYIRHGCLNVERMPANTIRVLEDEGRKKLTLGAKRGSVRAWRYGGVSVTLLFPELIIGLLVGKTYIARLAHRSLLRRYGMCQSCGYLLHGLNSGRCPECSAPFDHMEVSKPNSDKTFRRERFTYTAMAMLFGAILACGFHMMFSHGRPSSWESRLSLNPNPNASLVERGKVVTIRKDGGLGVVLIEDYSGSVSSYKAAYWSDEAESWTRTPDVVQEGQLDESTQQWIINVGIWRFDWSVCDPTRDWVYRPEAAFEVAVEPYEGRWRALFAEWTKLDTRQR